MGVRGVTSLWLWCWGTNNASHSRWLPIAVVCRWSDWVVCDERRDSGVPIWFGLESLTNVFNFKIMVIRINKYKPFDSPRNCRLIAGNKNRFFCQIIKLLNDQKKIKVAFNYCKLWCTYCQFFLPDFNVLKNIPF
jgi:hypothetical protein